MELNLNVEPVIYLISNLHFVASVMRFLLVHTTVTLKAVRVAVLEPVIVLAMVIQKTVRKRFALIKIRSFHPSDLSSIVEILQNTFSNSYEYLGLTGSDLQRNLFLHFKYEKWINRIERCVYKHSLKFLFTNTYDPVIFVAEGGYKNKVVGVATAYPITDDVWRLDQIAVLPDYRGRGIGSQLMRKIISHVKSKRGKKIEVYVTPNNRSAMKLHTELGFTVETKSNIMTFRLRA